MEEYPLICLRKAKETTGFLRRPSFNVAQGDDLTLTWRKCCNCFFNAGAYFLGKQALFGLFLPVGLLLRARPTRALCLLAFALPIGMEGIQVFVRSRVPSASDAAAGTIGILVGWGIGSWRRNGLGPSDILGGSTGALPLPSLAKNVRCTAHGRRSGQTVTAATIAGNTWSLGLCLVSCRNRNVGGTGMMMPRLRNPQFVICNL